jgi:hypothetical protein
LLKYLQSQRDEAGRDLAHLPEHGEALVLYRLRLFAGRIAARALPDVRPLAHLLREDHGASRGVLAERVAVVAVGNRLARFCKSGKQRVSQDQKRPNAASPGVAAPKA